MSLSKNNIERLGQEICECLQGNYYNDLSLNLRWVKEELMPSKEYFIERLGQTNEEGKRIVGWDRKVDHLEEEELVWEISILRHEISEMITKSVV